jgi:hypothetical protein
VYHHPALAGALAKDRVAELRRSAEAAARVERKPRSPNVIAAARLRTGWLLVDMGLRLVMPRAGTNRPMTGGQR